MKKINKENSESDDKGTVSRLKESTLNIILFSSIQGLPNIFRTKRFFFRLMWICLCLISLSLCIIYTHKSVVSFFEFDKITNIWTINQSEMPFPVVFICDFFNTNFELIVLYLSFNKNRINVETNEWKEYFEIYNDTTFGKCYKFNSGKNLFNQTTKIHNSIYAGSYTGLVLDLYVSNEKEDFGELVVLIQNQTYSPLTINEKGYYISSGGWNYFSIKKTYEKSLDYPYNDCLKNIYHFNKNRTLIDYIIKNNKTYNLDDCLDQCKNLIYLEQGNCNCSLEYSLDDDLYTKCVKKNNNPYTVNCTKNFVNSFQQPSMYSLCSDYCPIECDVIKNDILHYPQLITAKNFINSSKFKFPHFKTYENFTKTFISMNIYYDKLEYTIMDQKPKLELFDLISNIGGLFGLFLGMGLLSFVELFEIILEAFFIFTEKCCFMFSLRN